MNVVVLAARKGGAGKSTLALHLATRIGASARSTLLIDGDPQGSLALWHGIRGQALPALRVGTHGLAKTLAAAEREGVEWVFIDTPPNEAVPVIQAIHAATLVLIPMRPGLFDLDAVRATIRIARDLERPYAVVINAAPPKRGGVEDPAVADARGALAALQVPTWAGQITHRPELAVAPASGMGVHEFDHRAAGAAEIGQLCSTLTRTLQAIGPAGPHRAAA